MMSQCPQHPRRRRPRGGATWRELLVSLASGDSLDAAVPAALEIVEGEPLAAAACFPGDLLRALMEVPGSFWAPNPGLYERYLAVVRAGAAARRRLPLEQRMAFWGPLDLDAVRRPDQGSADGPAQTDRERVRG